MRTTATIINEAIFYSGNLTDIADIEAGSNPNLALPANLRASSRVMLELVALARKLQKYEDRELDLARDL